MFYKSERHKSTESSGEETNAEKVLMLQPQQRAIDTHDDDSQAQTGKDAGIKSREQSANP